MTHTLLFSVKVLQTPRIYLSSRTPTYRINLVIYYDTNSWSFTRLGKIDNVSQANLKAALGKGDVTVTFSLK